MSAKVTNTSPKIIGLGGQSIQPNETAALPDGFGLEHPTVDFFIRRGWLTKVTDGGIVVPPAAKADEEAAQTAKVTAKAAAEKDAAITGKVEALVKMSHDELRAEATRLGVGFSANAGPDLLRQRIADKYREG